MIDRRYLLPALAALLALACIVFATHELCAHVLAFDWSTVPAAPEAPAVSVSLPAAR